MRVLNVGRGSNTIAIPAHYEGWEHVLLDVNPAQKADVACDARELATLPAALYDAVYCSHNLEHYWRHDLPRVLAGFVHVLHAGGFAEVRVPDLRAVFAEMMKRGIDIDDTLYQSDAGPITVNDVIYGFGRQIAQSGNDFYAHRTASPRTRSREPWARPASDGCSPPPVPTRSARSRSSRRPRRSRKRCWACRSNYLPE